MGDHDSANVAASANALDALAFTAKNPLRCQIGMGGRLFKRVWSAAIICAWRRMGFAVVFILLALAAGFAVPSGASATDTNTGKAEPLLAYGARIVGDDARTRI